MSLIQHNPKTSAPPAGAYTNGISAPGGGRWLHIAGQVGIAPDGSVPEGFEEQAHVAWRNLVNVLEDAGMTVADLVKVNHFLLRAEDLATYGTVRSSYLGEARPASTLLIVAALARPQWLVEVDAVAWRAS